MLWFRRSPSRAEEQHEEAGRGPERGHPSQRGQRAVEDGEGAEARAYPLAQVYRGRVQREDEVLGLGRQPDQAVLLWKGVKAHPATLQMTSATPVPATASDEPATGVRSEKASRERVRVVKITARLRPYPQRSAP